MSNYIKTIPIPLYTPSFAMFFYYAEASAIIIYLLAIKLMMDASARAVVMVMHHLNNGIPKISYL